VIQTVFLPQVEGTISQLNLPSRARSVALWAEDSEYYTAALTDVVRIQ
jgi:hypothetical protein